MPFKRLLRCEKRWAPQGVRIHLNGDPDTLAAARRMIPEHAGMTEGLAGWHVSWQEPTLELSGPASEVEHIQALGFYGWLATGAHHQSHHFALAKGQPMHGAQ